MKLNKWVAIDCCQ